MNKIEAIDTIITDARAKSSTRASHKRLKRAMKALELDDNAIVEIEIRLEYRSRQTGDLYEGFK